MGGLIAIALLAVLGIGALRETPSTAFASLAALEAVPSSGQAALALASANATYSALVSRDALFSSEGVAVLFSPVEKDKAFKPIECTVYCKR